MNPDPKPTKRIKATAKDWQTMRWHKLTQGCRLCGTRDRVEFHHIVGRDLGGDDVIDNLVPLCPQHHQAVEERKPEASLLRDHLRASELRYVFEKKGIVFLNRYYPPWDEDELSEAPAGTAPGHGCHGESGLTHPARLTAKRGASLSTPPNEGEGK